jgi:hypothetical protein
VGFTQESSRSRASLAHLRETGGRAIGGLSGEEAA